MRRLVQDTAFANQSIDTVKLAYTYTADADRAVFFRVLLNNIDGNGDYTAYLTIQPLGAGAVYRVVPITTAAVASGVTAAMLVSGVLPVKNTDVVKVYVLGLAGDNDSTVDGITEVWDDRDLNTDLWHLDSIIGNDANDGHSWATAKLTWTGIVSAWGGQGNVRLNVWNVSAQTFDFSQLANVGQIVVTGYPGYCRGIVTSGMCTWISGLFFQRTTAAPITVSANTFLFAKDCYIQRATATDDAITVASSSWAVFEGCTIYGNINVTSGGHVMLLNCLRTGGTDTGDVVYGSTPTNTAAAILTDPTHLIPTNANGVIVAAAATVGVFPAAALATAPTGSTITYTLSNATIGEVPHPTLVANKDQAISWVITAATSQTGKAHTLTVYAVSDKTTALWTLTTGEIAVGGTDGKTLTCTHDHTHTTTIGTYWYRLDNTTDDLRVADGGLVIEA